MVRITIDPLEQIHLEDMELPDETPLPDDDSEPTRPEDLDERVEDESNH